MSSFIHFDLSCELSANEGESLSTSIGVTFGPINFGVNFDTSITLSEVAPGIGILIIPRGIPRGIRASLNPINLASSGLGSSGGGGGL
jgi:hypothetical protein